MYGPRPSSTASSASAIVLTTPLRMPVSWPSDMSREASEGDVGGDPAEHGVAEELEPLVALVPGMLGAPRPVGHRLIDEAEVVEAQPEPLGQRRRRRRSAVDRCGNQATLARALDDVVDGVAHGLEVGEVLVVDAEAGGPLAQLLLERLDQLDQRQRVGVEVVDERLTLGDHRRVDLEDVGEAVADDLEDLVALDGSVSRHRWAIVTNRPEPEPVAWPNAQTSDLISSTIACSTISAATPMALRIAVAPDEPWEMMQTPSTPSSTAPP